MNDEQPQAYIAGPYTNDDPFRRHLNVLASIEAGGVAARAGYLPIIPHTMGPHRGLSWEDAMTRCRDLVRGLDPERDLLVTLPLWDRSRGASEEVAMALERGVRVVPVESVWHYRWNGTRKD